MFYIFKLSHLLHNFSKLSLLVSFFNLLIYNLISLKKVAKVIKKYSDKSYSLNLIILNIFTLLFHAAITIKARASEQLLCLASMQGHQTPFSIHHTVAFWCILYPATCIASSPYT